MQASEFLYFAGRKAMNIVMKRKLTAMLSALTAVIGLLGGMFPANAAETFSDVYEIHWAYEAIERCAAKNWFSGYPDGTFRPDGSITRAEAIKVFVSFLGEPLEQVTESTYYDVDPSEWYAPYIEAGKELFPKRTSLDGQLKFQPDMPVTREDVIYAIVVALGYTDETEFADESILNMFSDSNSISSNVRAYAAVAVQNEFVAGHSDGTIGGQDPLTRAQFATLLARASEIGPKYSDTAIPKDVTISPSVMQEMQVGETLTLSSIMTYSDGSTEDYSDKMNPYTENMDGILSFNKNKVTAMKEGTAIVQFNSTHLADQTLVIVVSDNSEAPILNIDSYSPVAYSDSAVIVGRVSDSTGSAITLTCGSSGVMINGDGSFSLTVPLSSGANSFSFKAVNGHGKTTEKTIEIFRMEPTPEPTVVPFEAAPTATPTARPTPTPTATPTIPPTAKPTATPTATPTIPPTTPPTPPATVPNRTDDLSLTASTSVSGDSVNVIVSYDGMSNANITSAQFVLVMDSAKYTYSPGTSISYFGGAAAYQKSRGGVRYVYSGSGIKSSSGTFAKLSFTLNEGYSFDPDDFEISGAKIVSNSATYAGDDIDISIY